MILDRNRVYDGWDNMAAGMDAGRRPSLIDINQCSVARDAVFRGGVPRSRPGINQLELLFQNQIQYDSSGPSQGPDTLVDAEISTGSAVIKSVLANFIQQDIGTQVTGTYGIPDGTTLISVEAPTLATMSHNATETTLFPGGPSHLVIITLPPITDGVAHDFTFLTFPVSSFTGGDVGKYVRVEWTVDGFPHSVPDDTTILQVVDSHTIQVSNGVGSVGPPTTPGMTLTFIDQLRGPDLVVSLVGRNRPIVVDGAIGTFPDNIFSDTANFSQTDLGRRIEVRWFEGTTPHDMGDNCSITSVIDSQNITVSGGFGIVIGPTPNVQLTFPDRAGHPTGFTTIDAFRSGAFQCASYYAPPGIKECIMTTIGGRLFQITPDEVTATVREIPLGTRNRNSITENWMVQADKYHITQDGEAKPIIFDGVNARRAAADEVVVGTIMAYGIGRLVVVRGRDIFFGDLFGSHTGAPSDSILKFTETSFLNEGFPASIPYTLGDITGASFFPSQDTATGQGELVIFSDGGAVTFDLHLPRDQWKSTTFQQISLINSTARGSRAIVMVNQDLWIRSDEGWRAYRQARSQSIGWTQIPQSTEVSKWLNADTPNLLRYGSAINFDNRLLSTCNPVPNQGRLYHDGILALDFDVLSAFGQASRPAWDGHWGKLKTFQLVSGTFQSKHRAFALALDENDQTALYEITKDGTKDFNGPITSEIEFRSHNFSSPFNEKNLYGADIWVDEITEPVTMDLTFRPDSSEDYLPWKTFNPINPVGECGAISCGMCPTIEKGFGPRRRAGKPGDECDEQTGRGIRRGFEFQPKLKWTGHAAIRRMRLQAMQEEEDSKAAC